MIVRMVYLGMLSIWDIREKSVPVSPLLAGGALLLLSAINACLQGELSWGTMLGGLLPGAMLCLLAALTHKVGMADGIVMMAIGATCGLWGSLLLFFYSLVLLSGFSIFLVVLRKADGSTRIPYLPFLLIGYLACGLMGVEWL